MYAPVRAALAVSLVAVSVLVTGCGDDPARDERTVHAEGHGPLSASSGRGGKALLAPRADTWTGTFGGLLLCSTEPEIEVALEAVEHETGPEPIDIRDQLRLVPDAEDRRGDELEWAPIYGSTGSYRDNRNDHRGPTAEVSGYQIDRVCGDSDGDEGFTELLVELDVDASGGAVRSTEIHYSADGRSHTLVVDWQMVACGSQIQDPEQCPVS